MHSRIWFELSPVNVVATGSPPTSTVAGDPPTYIVLAVTPLTMLSSTYFLSTT